MHSGNPTHLSSLSHTRWDVSAYCLQAGEQSLLRLEAASPTAATLHVQQGLPGFARSNSIELTVGELKASSAVLFNCSHNPTWLAKPLQMFAETCDVRVLLTVDGMELGVVEDVTAAEHHTGPASCSRCLCTGQ
jgi:hypothetical protein